MSLVLTSALRPPHGLAGIESELIDLSADAFQWSIVVPFGAEACQLEYFWISLSDLDVSPAGFVRFERRAVTKSGVLFVATALRPVGDSSLPASGAERASGSLPQGGL